MSHEDLTALFVLDDNPGPARALPPARATALIDAVLLAHAAEATPLRAARTARAARRPLLWAAVLLLVAATAAAAYYVTRAELASSTPAPALTPASPEPAPIITPEPPPQPSPLQGEGVQGIPSPRERGEGQGGGAPREPAPREPAPREPAPREPAPREPERREPAERGSVDDLLARANAARAAKQWRAADRLYRQVTTQAPGTRSAHVAHVASGTLHLDRLADPRGALRAYRSALAIGGPLAEEARWGIAEAHRALGNDAAEREALAEFVRRHAGSPLADRARERQQELGR